MEDFFDNELGRKILALTKASFKVSDLISDLALREKIKFQILNVYKIFFEKKYSDLLKELDILDSFFFLAGHLNLSREEHVKSLRNGLLVFKSQIVLANYDAPKHRANLELIPRILPPPRQGGADSSILGINKREKSKIQQEKQDKGLNERQKKIMKQFQNKEILKLSEILKLFSDLSEKTIRNELNSLIGLKKIMRSGQGNGSFYQMFR